MNKRRKKRWILGGALGFVVLYSATALIVSRNNPDARLELVLSQFIADHGFEHKDTETFLGQEDRLVTRTKYEGEPISLEHEKRILDLFREACPSCSVEVFSYYYRLKPQDTNSFVQIVFILNDEGFTNADGSVDPAVSNLYIVRYADDAPWSFLKSLWPW